MHSAHSETASESLRDGFVLGGYTQKINIHPVGALAVRSPGGCG
jgi:hypothetical protein